MFEQAFKNIDDVLRKEAGCTTELDYTEQTSDINIGDIKAYRTPLPPVTERTRVVKRLEHVRVEPDRLAGLYQRKLAALEEFKSSLLKQAFSGEL